ncbi:MAG: hypothetical protein OK454_03960 [Thaumarchaeota archaeon]|nr:hypothetical protein [Nitrososphaerota archaeon]
MFEDHAAVVISEFADGVGELVEDVLARFVEIDGAVGAKKGTALDDGAKDGGFFDVFAAEGTEFANAVGDVFERGFGFGEELLDGEHPFGEDAEEDDGEVELVAARLIEGDDDLRRVADEAELAREGHDIAENFFFVARHIDGVGELLDVPFELLGKDVAEELHFVERKVGAVGFFDFEVESLEGGFSGGIDKGGAFDETREGELLPNGGDEVAGFKDFVLAEEV